MQDLLHRFLRILIAFILVIGVGSSLFYGGYVYGWYRSNWQRRLIDIAPYNNNLGEGFYQERNTLVLFGTLVNMDFQKKVILVSVFNNSYRIKINDKTSLIEGSESYEVAKNGNRVTIDMEYDKPFLADRIYFAK